MPDPYKNIINPRALACTIVYNTIDVVGARHASPNLKYADCAPVEHAGDQRQNRRERIDVGDVE